MKSRKNIALMYSLLLWAVLLCLSGYVRTDQVRSLAERDYAGNPLEQLSAEEPPHAIAWTEQLVSQASGTSSEYPLPLLVAAYGLSIYFPNPVFRKHNKVSAGFSSLCGQFRILPNAP